MKLVHLKHNNSTRGFRPWTPESSIPELSTQKCFLLGATKTEEAEAVALVVSDAVGYAYIARVIVPRAAVQDLVFTTTRAFQVPVRPPLIIAAVIRVVHPLPYVPAHIKTAVR